MRFLRPLGRPGIVCVLEDPGPVPFSEAFLAILQLCPQYPLELCVTLIIYLAHLLFLNTLKLHPSIKLILPLRNPIMSENLIHVSVRGTATRKVEPEQFEADLKAGLVPPDAMVWHKELTDWIRAKAAYPHYFGGSTPLNTSNPNATGQYVSPLPAAVAGPPTPPPQLAPSGNRLAGTGMRTLAFIIDSILLIPLFIGVFIVCLPLALIPVIGQIVSFLILIFASIILPAIVAIFCPSSKLQGTPGQTILGLKMEDIRGNKLTKGSAFGRYAMSYVSFFSLGLGYWWAFLHESNQTWHDSVCKVWVTVKENPSS